MGFWEITFLVWIILAVVGCFYAAVEDGVGVVEWRPFDWLLLLMWPLVLGALAGNRVHRWLGRRRRPEEDTDVSEP